MIRTIKRHFNKKTSRYKKYFSIVLIRKFSQQQCYYVNVYKLVEFGVLKIVSFFYFMCCHQRNIINSNAINK